MNTDKRPFYIWIFVILANVIAYMLMIKQALSVGEFGLSVLASPLKEAGPIVITVAILLQVVPILLSRFQSKRFFHLGYILAIVTIIICVWSINTCSGWFCGIFQLMIIVIVAIFALTYYVSHYLRKSNVKIVSSLIIFEAILILCSVVFFSYYSQLNSEAKAKILLVQEKSEKASTPAEIAEACDEMAFYKYGNYVHYCWKRATEMYPLLNLCNALKEPRSKSYCLRSQETYFVENYRYSCEDGGYEVNYLKKDDLNETARLVQCWEAKREMYPELNICKWAVYDWNIQRCIDYFSNTSQ